MIYLRMNVRTACCLASSEFSYSVLDLSPTMTLSGTTNDLSSLLRFFRVRLPTSGMFSHSSSVTTARPRFKSANCCCIFGRSARCFANSAFSKASLADENEEPVQYMEFNKTNQERQTFELFSEHPCSCRLAHRFDPLPRRRLHKWYRRINHIRYLDLEIVQDRSQALHLVALGPHCPQLSVNRTA